MQEQMHQMMPDGTRLFVRKFTGDSDKAVLVLPDVGESIDEGIYPHLQKHLSGYTSYFVDLRGHGHSHGKHILDHHWLDIQYWIIRLKKDHKRLYVIAKGLSASLLLKYEDQAHYLDRIPPIPDGLVLLAPLFEGRHSKSKDPAMKHFFLGPVRMQTPTRIFIPGKDYTTDHLKRFFGNCLTFKASWLHRGPFSHVEMKQGLDKIEAQLTAISKAEKPIRFSTRI
ncbi:hypothetical protein GOV11_04340 [Candidatus Woesearchaeota archaeon]|nr:hypothetical protein [Candidatus Woesearchaeota archaeon]